MSLLRSYQLRWERRIRLIRSFRKGRELTSHVKRTFKIQEDDIVLFTVVRNEKPRLSYFLQYYRDMGVSHFVIVDNDSTDGTKEYLEKQEDTSIWTTKASYKRARFGVDWLNRLLRKYGSGHWVLVVDVDEFFVFPHSDKRPLKALTDWLDASSIKSFGAMLLDMYSERPFEKTPYKSGTDPIKKLEYFDPGNYTMKRNKKYGNLWVQGGPRQRIFFDDNPAKAPALNKIPLVKWKKPYVYVSSTHNLLPRGLNLVYDEWGGEKATGCLLHAKFLDILSIKAVEELERKQHYAASREYEAYTKKIGTGTRLWTENSAKYEGWRQLEELGLMSSGNWI